MAVSNTQKDQLAAAGIVMFGVPMGGYSGMLESMLTGANGSVQSVIDQLAALPYFKSQFAGDNNAIAGKLANAYGLTPTNGGLGQQVKDFFLNNLNNGSSVPLLIKMANDFLFETTSPVYADTKALLMNKIAVGNFYTYDLQENSQNLAELQQAISTVSISPDSVASAKVQLALLSGKFNTKATSLTDGADTYTGTDNNDNVDGIVGNDKLDGGKGSDRLVGNVGDDTLLGGPGLDLLIGGSGADMLEAGTYYDAKSSYVGNKYVTTYTFDAFSEVLIGGDGADTLLGGYGSDVLYGESGADNITGDYSAYAAGDATTDQLRQMMNDTILGGDGADTIDGVYGTDWIDAGSGADRVYMPTGGGFANGGEGDDFIRGSRGNDTILGGEGNDTIENGYSDTIGVDFVDAGPGNDNVSWYNNGTSSGSITVIGGTGDDSINLGGFTGSASASLGEGADRITVGNGVYAIDLSETVSVKDVIDLNITANRNDPMQISKVTGFNVAADVIDVDSFQLVAGSKSSSAYTVYDSRSDGTLTANYLQQLSSPSTPFMGSQGSSAYSYVNGKTVYNPDYYGKGFFIITGASASAADTTTIAAFLNPYGNNASYAVGESHYFMVNIQNQGAALYYFKDDTGGNNNIVADELTPQVMLVGVTTESLSYLNFG